MSQPAGQTTADGPLRGLRSRRAIVLALLPLALLLVFELEVRALVGRPLVQRLPLVTIEANAFRGWRMRPGETHDSYGVAVRVNDLGFRGPELEPKRSDELRVVFLGASLLYGEGVEESETLTARVEQHWKAGSPAPFELSVVNTGHRAYGLGQQVGVLRELGEQLEADLVVCTWCSVNLADNEIPAAYAALQESGPVSYGFDRIVERDATWRVRSFVRRSALALYLYDWIRTLREKSPPPELTAHRLERFRQHLLDLIAVCEELDVPCVFVDLPSPKALREGPGSDPVVTEALACVRRHGLPVLDVSAALQQLVESAGRLPVLAFDGHYDAEAYAVAARALAEQLTRSATWKAVVAGFSGEPAR